MTSFTIIATTASVKLDGIEISDPAAPISWHDLPAEATSWALAQQAASPGDIILIWVFGEQDEIPAEYPVLSFELDHGLHVPAEKGAPVKLVDIIDASTCPTCRKGCRCGAPGTGCGHYACWGPEADKSCPEAQRIRATEQYRALYSRG